MVHILFFVHGIWLIIHTFLMHLLKMGKVTIETIISLIAAILYKNFHFLHALDLLLTSHY